MGKSHGCQLRYATGARTTFLRNALAVSSKRMAVQPEHSTKVRKGISQARFFREVGCLVSVTTVKRLKFPRDSNSRSVDEHAGATSNFLLRTAETPDPVAFVCEEGK